MRLSKIKLSGFKSFVDPTTVLFPSNLTGVVGPNGCGKSNIIDAVRWVMGESSAKNLRGESMTDVIFNGSTNRKPIGQASIELVFDNSDGTLGGQYAQYAEISIKRLVTREAISTYFLNGTKCRRRDVQDVFLGTGLGPRSYAIIEQGMISRLIEAKPEELRVFIEEAAGISKYKERRKETEARIRDTRENLSRLNDLRDEIGKQIERLQRQARTAERYKSLKQQERERQAQLLALRLREVGVESEAVEREITALELEFEATVARQRHTESLLEQLREQQTDTNDKFNETQAWFYRVGAEIARLEQAIAHSKERRETQRADLAQVTELLAKLLAEIGADEDKLAVVEAKLDDQEPALADAQEAEAHSGDALQQAQQALTDWERGWDDINRRAAQPTQVAEAERAKITQVERHVAQLGQRLERLQQEQSALDDTVLRSEVDRLELNVAEREAHAAVAQEQLEGCSEAISQLRQAINDCTHRLNQHRSELQQDKGRLASLQALQQSALGENDASVRQWLTEHALTDAPRLARVMQVEPGFESAAEAVLGHYLDAICVDDLGAVAANIAQLNNGDIVALDASAVTSLPANVGRSSLAAKLSGHAAAGNLAQHVYLAESTEIALAERHSLAAHESMVTPEGLRIGPNWLSWERASDRNAGVLVREREIETLQEKIDSRITEDNQLQGRLDADRSELANRERERDGLQAELSQHLRHASDSRSQLTGAKARLEHLLSRRARLDDEMAEIVAQREEDQAQMMEAQERLHEALTEAEMLAEQRDIMNERREELRQGVQQAQELSARNRERRHQLVVQLESSRTEKRSLDEALQRLRAQVKVHDERRQQLELAASEGDTPLRELTVALDAKLDERIKAEQALGDVREQLNAFDQQLRQNEAERAQAERRAQEHRTTLETKRLRMSEMRVRAQTWNDQLSELGFPLQQMLSDLAPEATDAALQKELERLHEQIERLGPINLAAIDEYREQSERQQYLDAQYKDLTDALETLENAIRKIDRETRALFKETFDRVNEGFQGLFPRVFGGGQAYLELTGEDLLETGITVMARPPGKRNSTIHLLSGGEKALTAVSLVFSIFALNPAPFCMLDEVDAPLDEANVGRFCDLVREMSEKVQFIFITHNKQAMEMSDHLIGVTMLEPGVSRPVSVDVEEAARMAAS